MTTLSAGARFVKALADEKPLQIVGTINANHALLAQRAGYKAIYLSGGGVAAGSLGLPDLGITTLEDVLIDVQGLGNATNLHWSAPKQGKVAGYYVLLRETHQSFWQKKFYRKMA